MLLISNLPDDILLIIYFKLKIKELLYFSFISKNFFNTINENVYWEWGKNKYSLKFWNKAFCRTPYISRPLFSIKKELIRIHIFQEYLKKHGLPEWNNEDFYKYWFKCEIMYNNYSSKLRV